MKQLHPLSVLITTNNEADHISACLDSVSWAEERIVVDSFSTDQTMEIAKGKGAIVHLRQYEGPSDQKNWGISQASNEWVLILDADERIPLALKAKIQNILAQKNNRRRCILDRSTKLFLGPKNQI